MFTGTFEHNIDEKSRITLPVKFREQLSDGAYIIGGFDRNLIILPSAKFDALAKKVNALSLGDPEARDLQRRIFEHAGEVEFDKAGRFILPTTLRKLAQLENEVAVVGTGERIEIWSPSLLAEKDARFDEPNAVAELASKYDLSF
jgi:MraZ protein